MSTAKPLSGVFPIAPTPFTPTGTSTSTDNAVSSIA